MSLEKALADNTAAIRELISILKISPQIPSASLAVVANGGAGYMGTLILDSGETPTTGRGGGFATKPTVTYDQVKEKLTEISIKKDRESVVSVLDKFGVKKASDLAPGQYEAVISACEEILK